jgi:hypothetical protein
METAVRIRAILAVLVPLAVSRVALAADRPVPANPAIDMPRFLQVAAEAAEYRETHRLSEDEFLRLSRLPGTVILDARSRQKYDELHVKGAINLSFPDIALDSLAATLPDKSALILIYCNNNFANAPGAFPSKLPSASLNISTYIALYDYGYRNVYELAPLLDIESSRLEFESAPRSPLSDRPESASIVVY